MSWSFEKILRGARKLAASDIHLVNGVAPALRITGEIRLLDGEALDPECLAEMISQLLNEKQRLVFQETKQLCISRLLPGVGRFRATLYHHAGCPEMAIRLGEVAIRTREE